MGRVGLRLRGASIVVMLTPAEIVLARLFLPACILSACILSACILAIIVIAPVG